MRNSNVYNRTALSQYQRINAHTGIIDADPHRLIQLLLDAALDRIAQAKGALSKADAAGLGESLGKAVDILSGLQSCLNLEEGGDIALRLDSLYSYMAMRLLDVHRERTAASLDEVTALLVTVKDGWDSIRTQVSPQ